MQQNARQIQLLALQNDACVKRLETLEEEITIPANTHGNAVNDRMSIMTTDTASSARSMRESIMSLYGHRSYYQIILDPREGVFGMAPEVQVDHPGYQRSLKIISIQWIRCILQTFLAPKILIMTLRDSPMTNVMTSLSRLRRPTVSGTRSTCTIKADT